MQIEFIDNTEKLRLKNKRKLRQWLAAYFEPKLGSSACINIVFFDDEGLLKLNQDFLQHDTYTDVITFYQRDQQVISGDICISVERVAENARQYEQSRDMELKRVIVHGFLHLAGYKDRSVYDKKAMKAAEDKALNEIGILTIW